MELKQFIRWPDTGETNLVLQVGPELLPGCLDVRGEAETSRAVKSERLGQPSTWEGGRGALSPETRVSLGAGTNGKEAFPEPPGRTSPAHPPTLAR